MVYNYNSVVKPVKTLVKYISIIIDLLTFLFQVKSERWKWS